MSVSNFTLLLLLLVIGTMSTVVTSMRLVRGSIHVSIILCRYKGSSEPSRSNEFFQRMTIQQGTSSLADYMDDVSYGQVNLAGSVVRGWYTLTQTKSEARSAGRNERRDQCREGASRGGYSIPRGNVRIFITSPGIDEFGGSKGAFLKASTDLSLMTHEFGHAISLGHSFSNDTDYLNNKYAKAGEYDDKWDVMSYRHAFAKSTPYGSGGPGLNAYHRDRMGWVANSRIMRFGADGRTSSWVRLTALNRPNVSGSLMVRIPFDVNDENHYYVVEYVVRSGWYSGIPSGIVRILEVKKRSGTKLYRSFLLRSTASDRAPVQALSENGVKILVYASYGSLGYAWVHVTSPRAALTCAKGYVWREAYREDYVCVTPSRRSIVRIENALASRRRNPLGGPYGKDTCLQGYVWRETSSSDRVCVTPRSRTIARMENLQAAERRLGGAVYGPNKCRLGYVWREIDEWDYVCVTPSRRAEVKQENLLQNNIKTRIYTFCKPGYDWRSAVPGDPVCVSASSRATAAKENRDAESKLMFKNA